MSDRSLQIVFASAGPGQAGEFASSLATWLNDTAVRETAADGAHTIAVELVPGNPNAQMDPDTVKLILEAAVHGGVAGTIVATAHLAFDHTVTHVVRRVAKSLVRWWDRNGRPELELATAHGTKRIDENSSNPEADIVEALNTVTKDDG